MTADPTPRRLMFVGDLILDEPDPDLYLQPSAETFATAAAVVGQLEVPHSHRGVMVSTDVPATPADPAHLEALPRAGITAVTLAGNHIADAGPDPIEDTIASLQQLGIAAAGAGMNIAQARQPAIVQAGDLVLGVLDYNCVGPRESWARESKAGCAYLNVLTHYELDHASPGGTPNVYTFATPETLNAMREDLAALRDRVDVLAVAFHKGIGHLRSVIAMYEREVARAAIDAGADVVVGHHAHIMRGIELYKGRAIYHGLGNYATVTHALTPKDNKSPEAQAWAHRREQLFNFRPDPTMPIYPFHPESRNTIIAELRVTAGGEIVPGLIPCWIDDQARPVPLGRDERGESVVAYVQEIGREAGLTTSLQWDGDWVVVREGATA